MKSRNYKAAGSGAARDVSDQGSGGAAVTSAIKAEARLGSTVRPYLSTNPLP